MAYRNGWPILSILTLVFTTLYQWGWVARYLDAAQVPLAIGIFTVFPVVGYGVLMVARSRARDDADDDADGRFEWTMLAASVLPVAFAVYLAMSSAYRDHYALMFGWMLPDRCGVARDRDRAIATRRCTRSARVTTVLSS